MEKELSMHSKQFEIYAMWNILRNGIDRVSWTWTESLSIDRLKLGSVLN